MVIVEKFPLSHVKIIKNKKGNQAKSLSITAKNHVSDPWIKDLVDLAISANEQKKKKIRDQILNQIHDTITPDILSIKEKHEKQRKLVVIPSQVHARFPRNKEKKKTKMKTKRFGFTPSIITSPFSKFINQSSPPPSTVKGQTIANSVALPN